MPTQRSAAHTHKPVSRPAASVLPSPLTRAGIGMPSGGQALDGKTERQMSARFGHDFSRVRIHSGAQAAASAEALGANAYALGSDIVFGDGKYQPGSKMTERLLAHELTHVAQQDRFGPGDWGRTSDQADASEREANSIANRVMQNNAVRVSVFPDAALARDEKDESDDLTGSIPQNPLVSPWYQSGIGQKIADGVSGPYYHPNGLSGGGLGFAHAHYQGDKYEATADAGYLNADAGHWSDDAGNTRYGGRDSAGVFSGSASYDFGNGASIGGEGQALTLGGEASIGDDGATLGGGATLIGGAATINDGHESNRFGLSAGPSLAGRLHWDRDQNGYRNFGAGADFAIFSADFKTNDPVRSLMGPMKYLMPQDENLTDDVAHLFGGTTRTVPQDTKAQAEAQAVMNQNADALTRSETENDLYGSSASVAHEEVPKAPIQMLPPDKDPWR